ncbi:MAG: CbtB domain-containing protein [Thermoplasmata archaeon]
MWERLRRWLPANAAVYVSWIVLAALVATAVFYVMGFAQATAAHDVFHDLRHAVGVPCH